MGEKRVVAVIVEGPSDENAIGGIMKEYFSSDEVQFAVVHGDITSSDYTTVDNVVRKIDDLIDGMRDKYGYHWDDFIQIIHIADTDGAFTKGCVQETETETIQYYEDHMESSNVVATERRNIHKAVIMFKLYSTGKIHNKRYNLYFNSCNLEHVLYNELKDFSIEERAMVKKALLEMECFPAGMEEFPALDLNQFEYIKSQIESSDYLILILGGNVGTINSETKKSYTYMEYEYAKKKGFQY